MTLLYNRASSIECIIAAACKEIRVIGYTAGLIDLQKVLNIDESEEKSEIVYVFPNLPHDLDPRIMVVDDSIAFAKDNCGANALMVKDFFDNHMPHLQEILAGLTVAFGPNVDVYDRMADLFGSFTGLTDLEDLKVIGATKLKVIGEMIAARQHVQIDEIKYFRVAEYIHYNILNEEGPVCVYVDLFDRGDEPQYSLFYYRVSDEWLEEQKSKGIAFESFTDRLIPDMTCHKRLMPVQEFATFMFNELKKE
jgi:hypothetical protein